VSILHFSSLICFLNALVQYWFRKLRVVIVILFIRSTLPSANSLGRWFGESVRAAIVNTDVRTSCGYNEFFKYKVS
jgi:hypothetical protein